MKAYGLASKLFQISHKAAYPFGKRNGAPIDFSDVLTSDLKSGDLHSSISCRLNKKYLSVCEESVDEILSTTKYHGIIYGQTRWFISIPTRPYEDKEENEKKYKYVHFLVNSGSHITRLTHEALCALYEKDYSVNTHFPGSMKMTIGSRQIWVEKFH